MSFHQAVKGKCSPRDALGDSPQGFTGNAWRCGPAWRRCCICLRDFFFLIFTTFLLSYFVRRTVNLMLAWSPVERRTRWLDRGATIMVYIAVLAVFAGFLMVWVPKAFEQGREVVLQIEHAQWQVEFDSLLRRTMGEYLLRRESGDPTDPRYRDALAAYRAGNQVGGGIFAALPSWDSAMRARFDAGSAATASSQADRQTQVAKFWQEKWNEDLRDIPFDFESFSRLKQARARGEAQFRDAFQSELARLSEADQTRLIELDFQIAQQDRLAADWWSQAPTAISIRHYLNDEAPAMLGRSGASLQAMIRACFEAPLQLGLAIVFSFSITVDVHRIREHLEQLRETRIRKGFDAIAGELVVLSRLLGKSLEAQILIAALIAAASFVAMWWLGIENKYLLAMLVFVANLIPIAGPVVATITLGIGALMQPDGSTWLAMKLVIATTLIHSLTHLIITPRILGKWFHLHPVLTLVILVISEHFFGVWGLILGVPLTVYIIRVLILDIGVPNGPPTARPAAQRGNIETPRTA